jgi:hypothetical protein
MSRLTALSVVVTLGLAGCDSDRAVAPTDVDASTPTSKAFDEDFIYLATLVGDAVDSNPLEGVEVCDDASGRCVETDSSGWFVLDRLSPQTETFITYRLAGYRSALHPLVTPRFSTRLELGVGMVPLARERERAAEAQKLLREAGRPEFDLSPEHLDSVAQIDFGAASEVGWALGHQIHIALDPPSGDGPIYQLFPTNHVALELASEDIAFAGTFVNVEPREEGYEVVYSRDSGSSCTYYDGAYGGWPSRTGRSNAHHVPVRSGYLTWYTQCFCGEP